MKITQTPLPDVLLLQPVVHEDDRGFFYESYNRATFRHQGIDVDFVQSNVSRSRRGVLRGLHYQWPLAQGKLVSVLEGEVYDVAVDIRPDSPTFGHHVSAVLSAENKRHIWIPEGFAHGFCVLSEFATFAYQCTAPYDRASDGAIRWNDATLSIDWPISSPELSVKDANAPYLNEVAREHLPSHRP